LQTDKTEVRYHYQQQSEPTNSIYDTLSLVSLNVLTYGFNIYFVIQWIISLFGSVFRWDYRWVPDWDQR